MQYFLIKYGGHPYSLEYGGRHANLALLSLKRPPQGGVGLVPPPQGGDEMTARRSRGGPQSIKYLVPDENGSVD
jgi:hypothetical protein